MKHNKVYLIHILEEIEFIEKQSKNLKFDEFVENEIYTRAFSRSIEIIGEAVKNISDDLKKEYSEIQWKQIAGMRDKLIHQYFSVDYEIIWDVVKNKLPEIKPQIKQILKSLK